MPSISKGKVLVTGASGFIATHVVKTLLEHGFDVVGTVRSQSKGEYLKQQFVNFDDKFSYVIVEDIEKPGAFDEAVKGVDAVEHTASPFHMLADDPNELFGPAIKGTTGILESVVKNGSQVKRVVVTSSMAAVAEPKPNDPKPFKFTEADWNDDSPRVVEEQGKNAPNGAKYRASKSLAERAAWDFVTKRKGEITWDLVTINPPWVFGPTIHDIPSIDSLNESVSHVYKNTISAPAQSAVLSFYGNYVDVRDVALAHVLAIETEKAGGERFIVAKGAFRWQEVYDILREARISNIPEGYPAEAKTTEYVPDYIADGSKAERVLGLKYTDGKKTWVDTIESIRARFPEVAK